MTVRGLYGKLPKLPATPGYEGIGIVEAAGPGLYGKLLVGKRAAFLNGDNGNWQEQTLVNARQVVPLSSAVPLEQGAMFFVNPTTAYAMTREVLRVPPGAWLVQTAAGSSLGRMVIRLGKRFGFRTLCIVRRKEQAEELRSLGADATIAADVQDLSVELQRITGGEGIRYAVDCVGGKTASALVENLGPGGRLLLYGTLSGEPITFGSRSLMTPGASIEGFWLARWMPSLSLLRRISIVRTVGSLIKEGVLLSEVGRSYSLDQISDAVVEAERVAKGGKVLLRIGS
jgi:NADPH:quinone reductase-like Zn-dependent oxidoreductase